MRKFTRTVEDFVCGHCGHAVSGTGYTNHCPRCLVSKHVDIHPGDRAADCGGLMDPVAIARKRDNSVIVQRCRRCGHTARNKSAPDDSFEAILGVARRAALAPR